MSSRVSPRWSKKLAHAQPPQEKRLTVSTRATSQEPDRDRFPRQRPVRGQIKLPMRTYDQPRRSMYPYAPTNQPLPRPTRDDPTNRHSCLHQAPIAQSKGKRIIARGGRDVASRGTSPRQQGHRRQGCGRRRLPGGTNLCGRDKGRHGHGAHGTTRQNVVSSDSPETCGNSRSQSPPPWPRMGRVPLTATGRA